MDKLIINGLNGLDNVTAFNSDDKLTVTIGSSKLLTLDEALVKYPEYNYTLNFIEDWYERRK